MSEKITTAPKKSRTKTSSGKPSPSGNGRTHDSWQANPVGTPDPNVQEPSSHPWAPLLGKYADDPDWDELMEAIRVNREELDTEVSKAQ